MSSPARVLYFHAGTHKTGTTALQYFLAANERALAELGAYVPRAGAWNGQGHHNVAFQLNADSRFDPAAGTLRDLCFELRDSGAMTACVSSEDFCAAYANVPIMRALNAAFAVVGFTVRPVLYLRPQLEYLESLYQTMLLDGFTLDFDQLAALVCGSSPFAVQFARSLRLDYEALLDAFDGAFGIGSTLARRYEPARDPAWIVRDFLGVAGVVPSAELLASAAPANPREPLATIGRALLRNRGVEPAGALREQLETLEAAPDAGPRFRPASARIARAFVERFGPSNERVAKRYGIAVEPAPAARYEHENAADADPSVVATRRLLASIGPG